MRKNNELYKNQGIHVITAIFTVSRGVIKILLKKYNGETFFNCWTLIGGALYNNEDLDDGVEREILEKTGIKDIYLEQFKVFGKVERSSVMRMIAVGYIGIMDVETARNSMSLIIDNDAEWFDINNVPKLGFDHRVIFKEAVKYLQTRITNTQVLKKFFPNEFTLPELQMMCENLLGTKIDRRNFRKKFLDSKIVVDTNKIRKFVGKKPAKLYRFKKNIKIKNIL